MTLSRELTIFEGPDGAGKTTLAKAYAELTGARYVHFGPLPRVLMPNTCSLRRTVSGLTRNFAAISA